MDTKITVKKEQRQSGIHLIKQVIFPKTRSRPVEYKKVIEEFSNGTNISLIPMLTPEEEKQRKQRLNDAAMQLLQAWEKCGK